jgi:hypothetical protein
MDMTIVFLTIVTVGVYCIQPTIGMLVRRRRAGTRLTSLRRPVLSEHPHPEERD